MTEQFSIPFFAENYGLRLLELEEVWAANDLLFRAQLIDNQRVALKIFRSSNPPDTARLAGLNAFLRFLKSRKIASVGPSEFLKGEPRASIRAWSNGEKVMRPTAAFCQKLGAATAKVHVASEAFLVENPAFQTLRIDRFYLEKVAKRLAPAAAACGFSAALFLAKAERLAAAFERLGAVGLIHSDLHFGNLLRRKSDGEPIFLDWDEIALGPFLLDLGPILADFSRFPAQRAAFEAAFFAGYLAHRSLPPGWEKALPTVRAATGLLAASWFFAAENAHVRAMPERANFGDHAFSVFFASGF